MGRELLIGYESELGRLIGARFGDSLVGGNERLLLPPCSETKTPTLLFQDG